MVLKRNYRILYLDFVFKYIEILEPVNNFAHVQGQLEISDSSNQGKWEMVLYI